jgi:type II secretory pathway component PulK
MLPRALGNNRGAVLVITLFVVALVTILVLDYHLNTTVEGELTDNYANTVRAYHLALSGLQFARAILEQDDPASDAASELWYSLNAFGCVSPEQLLAMVRAVSEEGPDFFREREAEPDTPADSPGSACVKLSIVDESRKLPLNALVNEQGDPFEQWRTVFNTIFAELEIDEDVIDALVDWIDSGGEGFQEGGGEDAYYESLEPPYKTPDRPIEVPGELRLIRHFTCETLAKLFLGKECKDMANIDLGTNEYLTPYGDASAGLKVNINTANETVLRAITQGDASCVENILAERLSVEGQQISQAIQDVSQICTVEGFDQFAGVASTHFRIESEAVIEGLIKKKIVAVLKRGAGGGAPGRATGAFTMVYFKVE